MFGGKCFDITLDSPEQAAHLAASGFDYDNSVKPLRLLGSRTIHVSIFVSVEYPYEDLLSFLRTYGTLKRANLRLLYYNEEGFTHIERGIRVAEFTSLDRDLPGKIVTNGLEVHFEYTGQPVTCYRCGSTEDVVQNCPNKSHPRGNPSPPVPSAAQDTQDPSSAVENQSENSEVMETAPASYAASVSQNLFGDSQEPSRKRPPPSPDKDDNPAAKKGPTKPALTPKPSHKRFLGSLKQTGPDCMHVMLNMDEGRGKPCVQKPPYK